MLLSSFDNAETLLIWDLNWVNLMTVLNLWNIYIWINDLALKEQRVVLTSNKL